MSWMLCNHASSANLCTLSLCGMLYYLCTCHSVYNSVYASVGQCAGIRFGCLVERSEACDSTTMVHPTKGCHLVRKRSAGAASWHCTTNISQIIVQVSYVLLA